MSANADLSRRLLPGLGPLLRAADPGDHRTCRVLERAWRTGTLLRLAPRVYIETDRWRTMPSWDRHSVAAVAFSVTRRVPAVFTGLTGAHLRGLPVAMLPGSLAVRATAPGHRGRRPFATSLVAPGSPASGHVPAPPEQWPRWGLPVMGQRPGEDPRTKAPAGRGTLPRGEPVEVSLSTGDVLSPVLVDALPTLLLVLATKTPFRDAVTPLDALARREPALLKVWTGDVGAVELAGAARERLRRVAGFVDPRSESAGESYSRALIEELGFEPPTALQHTVLDAHGQVVARTDFWWERERLAGEFDGIGKYDLALHGGDDTARRRSIRREKEREVALQRLTNGVAHWTWADLREPRRLARILTAFGVPRR